MEAPISPQPSPEGNQRSLISKPSKYTPEAQEGRNELAGLLIKLRRRRDELKKLANTDHLTGLHNRKRGMELLKKACSVAEMKGTPLSVLMLDIDHFKRVNDICGHAAGDKVLTQVGDTLRSTLRDTDDEIFPIDVGNSNSEVMKQKSPTPITTARIGGEELLVVLPLPKAEAIIVAERLRSAIESLEIQREGMPDKPIKVTVSIGISNNIFDSNNNPHDLLGTADKFLYLAKENGRNQVVSHDRAEQILLANGTGDNYVI